MTSMTKQLLRPLLLSALAAAALAFAGCKRAEASNSTAYKTVAASPAAPSWQLTDLNGKPVSSADFKGKVVVIDFWATWCPPCVHEIPGYIEFQKKHGGDKVTIVGLSLDEIPAADVKKFADKKGINYPVAIAPQELLAQFASVEGIPATFIVDRDGKLRFMKVGSAPIEDLEKTIADLF